MPNEFAESEGHTPHPQLGPQCFALEDFVHPIHLDEGDLQAESHQPDHDEQRIPEKTGENVPLAVNLSGVHLVK